ncbi:MAG TPA: response regulator transcription factor [Anaerolineae bacterium]|nr:response regulator transcription factor [Anaerolineae bacterium]HQH37948.1 response regulator transcription factor [Anaerolineae bacterium]
MPDPIRVLIADDHLIVREGLRLILETAEGMELVGEAADGAEAVRLASQVQPDVVLMDLRMPGMDGLTAIERLRVTHPHIAVVILTTYNEDDLMVRGLKAGARGYLLKDTNREMLFHAIRAAARGEMLLKPEIVAKVLAHTAAPPAPARPLELTEREHEILEAIARGERSKEIADHLYITERTVKAHLTSIYNKLGVDSRAAAVAEAIQRGWLVS